MKMYYNILLTRIVTNIIDLFNFERLSSFKIAKFNAINYFVIFMVFYVHIALSMLTIKIILIPRT